MQENWETYKLDEISQIGSSKRIFRADYVEKGIPFYRSKEIIQKSFSEKISDPLFIDEQKYFKIKAKYGAPGNGDILISSVGNRSGIPYLVNNDGDFYFKDGNLLWFRNFNNEVYSPYLFQWLKSYKGQNLLLSSMIGSAQKALTIEGVKSLEITLPTLKEQHSIASILSALDDKIELNLQMNKTLEGMASALYKHWFVDFGPFREREFIESELGMIPEGWEVKKLPEISKNHNKKRKPISTRERAKRQGVYPYYGATKILDYIDDYKFDGEFILLAEDGTVKTERDTPYLQFVEGKFWVSNHAHVLTGTKEFSNEFLYLCLNNKNIIPIITGAVQLKINKQNLESIEFVVPPLKELKFFEEQIIPLFKQQKFVVKENQTLTSLRDTLLPRLISGEVRVKDAEKILTETL